MPDDKASQAHSSAGFQIGDVGGDLSVTVGRDWVGRDKIVNITKTTTIQISVEAITQRPLVTASPYRGLERFEDRDKDLFFGRDQLIKSLVAQINTTNVILVLGASGSGKSSVVRAGLLPVLSGELGAQFRYFTVVPDINPFESLRSSLQSAGFSQSQTRHLADAQPGSLSSLIRALQREGDQWLVFVDQFEEIFTLSEERFRNNFIAALLEIAQDPASSTKLVLAMRADFLDRFSAYPRFAKLIEKKINLIADMHSDELRLAIEQPAARHGLVFEQGLVEEIIKEVQGQPGSLPLLQYTLNLLWEEERRTDGLADRHLNTRTYRDLGGVRGALQKRADEIYASFGDNADPKRASPNQEMVRQIFLRLVDLAGVGSDDAVWRPVRRRIAMTSFVAAREQELLHALINQKLLVSNREGAEATVEVAHEALFTSWERLKKWIEGGKQVIFARNRLADDARRWHLRQQKDSANAEEELLGGSRLAQALEMRARGDFAAVVGGLDEIETQFLDASAALREHQRQEERDRQQRELEKEKQLRESEAGRAREAEQRAKDAELHAREQGEARRQIEAKRKRLRGMAVLATVLALLAVIAALLSWGARRLAVEKERDANRQLAEASWLVAQGARGDSFALREESPIKAAHYLLRAAKAAVAAGDRLAARDASLAGQIAGSSPVYTLLHDGPVVGATNSPDGHQILTWSQDGTARLWEATDGKAVGQLMQHEGPINGAQFSADGQRILTWSGDRTARLWQAADGSAVGQPMKHEREVNGAQFSADGQRILTWSRDGTARLWQAADGSAVGQPMKHEREVNGAQFSADGQRILTWSQDGGTARLWQAADGSAAGEPMKHERWIAGAQFSADGQRILTWGTGITEGGIARLWEAVDTSATVRLAVEYTGQIKGAQFSADGQRILTWAGNGIACLWQAASGLAVSHQMKHELWIAGAQFSPDGRQILTWSGDRTARLWQAADGSAVGQPMKHEDSIAHAQFSVDGQRILTWSYDGTVHLWQAADGAPVGQQMKHEGWIARAQFSADGQRILTSSHDGTARLWQADHNSAVGQPMKHKKLVRGAQFSADGQRILTWSDDGTARLWQAADGSAVGQPMKHEPWADEELTTDGQRILTWSIDGTVQLWRLADGSAGQAIEHHQGLDGAKLSIDGQRILTLSDGTVQLWQAADGAQVGQPMKDESPIKRARFSPNGQRILTWSYDGTVRLWQAADGAPVGQQMKHNVLIDRVQFSADGQRILTWTSDGVARLWQAADGKPVGPPMKMVNGGNFSADGQRVLTWSYDGTVRLWQAADGTPVGQPMRHERSMAGAQLSANGQRVLTWSYDGTVRLWQAGHSPPVGQPMKHKSAVNGAQFSADGQRILTWSDDGTARLWQQGNNQCIAVFQHSGAVRSASFSPDQIRLLTTSDDTVRLWDISLDESIPVEERILEFEFRTATTLGSDGQVRVLRVAEWEAKQRQLASVQSKRLAK